MDLVAIAAGLRMPRGPHPVVQIYPLPTQRTSAEGSLSGALRVLDLAIERQRRAQAEASRSARPSTMKATLKSTTDVERARQHVRAELHLLAAVDALRAG